MILKSNQPCWLCNSSDGAALYEDGWYCFSCKSSKKTNNDTKIISKRYESVFPKDYTQEIPKEYQWWYKQYNISQETVNDYEFGYSKYFDRIIIPLNKYHTSCVARSLNPQEKAKYLVLGDKRYTPFYTNSPVSSLGAHREDIIVILVEDCLSAIKVSLALSNELYNRYWCWAILGTGNRNIQDIILKFRPKKVIVWLDGDGPGKKGSLFLYNTLLLYLDCIRIETSKDPKEYDLEDIKCQIRNIP